MCGTEGLFAMDEQDTNKGFDPARDAFPPGQGIVVTSRKEPAGADLRVVIITDSLRAGGSENQTVLSAGELTRRGVPVTLISYHPANCYADDIRRMGIRFVQVEGPGLPRLVRLRRITRIFREFRPNVVHAFGCGASLYSFLAGRLSRTRHVFGGFRGQAIAPFALRMINRLLWYRSTGWIVNARPVIEPVIRGFGVPRDRIHIVPNGVPLVRFESSLTRQQARESFDLPQDRFIVTAVANLRPVKNHPMLFRAAKKVLARGVPATFVIAGEGLMRGQLEEMARNLGIADHLRLLGTCDRVPDLLRASDLVALTSISEGLPNALLEAGGAGLAVVSSDNGGANEVIVEGETGFIVAQNDDQAMADRLCQLHADTDLRLRLGGAGAHRVRQEFSMEAMGDRLLQVYRKALSIHT